MWDKTCQDDGLKMPGTTLRKSPLLSLQGVVVMSLRGLAALIENPVYPLRLSLK